MQLLLLSLYLVFLFVSAFLLFRAEKVTLPDA